MEFNKVCVPSEIEVDEAWRDLLARKISIIGDHELGDYARMTEDGFGSTSPIRGQLAALVILLAADVAQARDEITRLKREVKEAAARFAELENELAIEHEMTGG